MVGNLQNFTRTDILRCFLKFNKKVSRKELAKNLELGEGTVRTILDILKEKNLLDSNKKGHFLSKKGHEVIEKINNTSEGPKNIEANFFENYRKTGVLVRNVANLKEVYKLRDIAVKNRADGALILKFDDKIFAPESDYKYNYDRLHDYFVFKKNDVLIISFSTERRIAEIGALAIAVELNPLLKDFIKDF